MNKDESGHWIVDELVFEPHMLDGRVVARDGDAWYIVDGRFPNREPVPYRAQMSPVYERIVLNHEYLVYNCAPRGGFKVKVGRAITDEELASLTKRLGLGEDDISNPFEAHKGGIFGEKAMVRYMAKQIRIDQPGSKAIAIESELLDQGIEASNGSSGRVNIRVA
jgi:hypothetical protein